MSTTVGFRAGLVLLALLASACSAQRATGTPQPTSAVTEQMMNGMAGMGESAASQDYAPPVKGFYAGQEILFLHTEASDRGVANMLTEMMGPEVLWVPQLAVAPAALLANVYVFTNGLAGSGPFGFQADVFDAVPGDESYRPLRAVNLVSWNEGVQARELRSVADITAAAAAGELTITQPGIVVNMPVLTWPGGSR